MEAIVKQVIEVPKETFENLLFKQDCILEKINNMNREGQSITKEWLSPKEYMEAINIKRTRFEGMKSALRTKKSGENFMCICQKLTDTSTTNYRAIKNPRTAIQGLNVFL
ncbi:MAG: hypothetical protein RJQ09_05480 [Cyclobacteriaceae bacterium]